MAARTRRIMHDENTRAKIQSSQIINHLQKHIFGKLKRPMQPSQVSAALGLLKKTLPDLQKEEMTFTGNIDLGKMTDEQLETEICKIIQKNY